VYRFLSETQAEAHKKFQELARTPRKSKSPVLPKGLQSTFSFFFD
jgi:hypothetical protein